MNYVETQKNLLQRQKYDTFKLTLRRIIYRYPTEASDL